MQHYVHASKLSEGWLKAMLAQKMFLADCDTCSWWKEPYAYVMFSWSDCMGVPDGVNGVNAVTGTVNVTMSTNCLS